MRVLITGGSGDLGKEIVRECKKSNATVLAPSHCCMEMADSQVVMDTVVSFCPDIIVHTAAIIDARKCETEWELARRVNVGGTYNICRAANEIDAKVIHVSSTCVFDGEHAPFNEYSKPGPKNWYAMTKLMAEQVVQLVANESLIVRTNFVARKPWKYPKAFIDRFGTYLFADDVAYGICKYADKHGIIHVCGKDRMSMYDLAKLVSPDVEPMTLDEYHGPPVSRDMSLESVRVRPLKIGCAQDDIPEC